MPTRSYYLFSAGNIATSSFLSSREPERQHPPAPPTTANYNMSTAAAGGGSVNGSGAALAAVAVVPHGDGNDSGAAYGASGTSCYTDAVRRESYETAEQVLDRHCASSAAVRRVILDLLAACAAIATALRSALVHVEGTTNDFGDAQLSVDVSRRSYRFPCPAVSLPIAAYFFCRSSLTRAGVCVFLRSLFFLILSRPQVIADRLLWDAVRASPVVREGASEEDPVVRNVDEVDGGSSAGDAGEKFTVCWDPLDGSSIADNNWAVGTIVGVWPRRTGLLGATGRDQVTSLVALYGPRTTVLVALDDGVYEFTHGGAVPAAAAAAGNDDDPRGADAHRMEPPPPPAWICTRHGIQIRPESKIFSPANLRAAQDLPGYQALVNHYLAQRYTLRYTGGLVPDVYQQFTKRQGVFTNPTSPNSPAKLRLAFEAAPLALLVEKAGGKTSDGVTGRSVLDVTIAAVDQRTALCLGSAREVDRFNELVCRVEAKPV